MEFRYFYINNPRTIPFGINFQSNAIRYYKLSLPYYRIPMYMHLQAPRLMWSMIKEYVRIDELNVVEIS